MSKYFELIKEIFGWLQIVASPLLIGVLIGAIIYFPNPTNLNLIIAILVCLIGLIVGIVFANRKFKSRNGTIWFLSRTMATPELDKKDESKAE